MTGQTRWKAERVERGVSGLRCLLFAGLLIWPLCLRAIEDPPGCSLFNGGLGNTSQGGINFNPTEAHVGDVVPVFPSLGMASNACRAINATGTVYIASGLLVNFLENVNLDPGVLVACPAGADCRPGPYNVLITPALVGAGVNSPNGGVPGVPKVVRAVENGFGTVLAGIVTEQLANFHTTSILIVTPCIQVFTICDLPSGSGCFPAGEPVRVRGYVTNCGDITLTNVTVVNDQAGPVQLFHPTSGLALVGNVSLPVGAHAVFSNSFLPTLQNTCAGTVPFGVTATARDTTVIGGPRAAVTNSVGGVCAICVSPAIVVAKTCPTANAVPGGILTFSGSVTNTGNIPLTNVTVTSDRLLTNGSALVASFLVLTNGEFRTFSGSYLVPATACSLTDTLTVEGTTACGFAGVSNSVTRTCAVNNSPPSITCAGDKTGGAGVVWTFDPPAVEDSEDGTNVAVTVVQTVTNVICGDSFIATRTWRVTDSCGNSSECSQRVMIWDTTPPMILCSSNLVLTADAGRCSRSNVAFTVTATDDCAVALLVSVPPSGSTFPVGVTTVTNTAVDASGNSSGCTFTVTVLDAEGPTLLCPGDLVVTTAAGLCGSNVVYATLITDNCGVAGTNQLAGLPSGVLFPVGVTTNVFWATDTAGNTNTCRFTVTVLDAEKPAIICPANLVVTNTAGLCGSAVMFAINASDNCGVVGTNQLAGLASGSFFPVGVTTNVFQAMDAAGNTNVCSFTVTVLDAEKPAIICPANRVVTNATGLCGSNVIYAISASDNCSVVSTNQLAGLPSGSLFPVGVTTNVFRVTDAAGNTNVCSFTVTVLDSEKPAIICPANLVVTNAAGLCGSTVMFVISASDNCGVVGTNQLAGLPSGSLFPVGVTTNVFRVTDAAGNTNVCSFTVTVLDTEKPVATCPANLVVTNVAGLCGSTVMFVISASDNCGVVGTNQLAGLPSGSLFPVGVTTNVFRVTDAAGNTNVCSFTVTVLDAEKPVVTCPANLVVTNAAGLCGSNVAYAITASDNCGVVGTNQLAGLPNGALFPVGVTTNVFRVTDAAGNTNVCSFTVTVLDAEQPVITGPANLVGTNAVGLCGSIVTFAVSASDNCGVAGTNQLAGLASGSLFPVGVTTNVFQAMDAAGNTNVCSFTVTVLDTEKPVATCPANLVVTNAAGLCGSNVTFAIAASDNCGVTGTNLLAGLPSGSLFPVGVTTNVFRVTDAAGNTNVCSFTVRVIDSQAPVILCSSNLVLTTDAGWCGRSNVVFTVAAMDNCSVTNVTSTPPSGSAFGMGVTTVTNTATDAGGNTSSCTFTVTVRDVQIPALQCSSNLVLTADAGQCSRSNVVFDVSANDNCSVTNLLSNPPSGSTFPLGTTTVTSRATDNSGNSNQCTFTVTVLDQQPPGINCPPDLVVDIPHGHDAVTNLALGTPFSTDNCAVAGVTNNAPAVFEQGVTFVQWTATDASGNSNSCLQEILVRRCSGQLSAAPLTNLTICPNRPVRFETVASAPEPVTYTWLFNGQPIAGQTNNSLALPSVSASGGGVYTVEVRTPCAAVTNRATLTVLPAPGGSPVSYTNAGGIIINESGQATPYVSLIPAQCVPGVVKHLSVNIYGFSHNFPSDVSIVLVSPDGRKVKLMGGTGNGEGLSPGVNLTFSDVATNRLPLTERIVSGLYLPTDYEPGFSLPPPGNGPYSNSLAAFIGADSNGPWILFVFDGVSLDGGRIASWTLDIDWREKLLYLQNPGLLPDGSFRAEIVGQTGIPTIIEQSDDLYTWQPVATNVYFANPGVFIAPSPVHPGRYYRAVQP